MTNKEMLISLIEYEEKNDYFNLTTTDRREFQIWVESLLDNESVMNRGIKALELLDTLADRPCEVCKHHEEGECSQWECVFNCVFKERIRGNK